MNNFYFFLRTLYRRKAWLLAFTLLAAIIAAVLMKNKPDTYKSETIIYTGIVSGYDMVSMSSHSSDLVFINSTIDNLITIIKSQPTLKAVSIKLLAQHLMHLDPDNDNEYLTAESSRDLIAKVPVEVLGIVDPDNFEQTVENLTVYSQQNEYNFVYGLFQWKDPHYSYEALSTVEAKRIGTSDMLEMSYMGNDKYIVYNTLKFLNDEFVNQYNELRFQQTNKVIEYFRNELALKGSELNSQENALRDYNVRNSVINYEQQTRIIAEREGQLNSDYEKAQMEYRSALSVRESLELKLDDIQVYKNNAHFLEKLREISNLYSSVTSSSIDITGTEEKDPAKIRANAQRQRLITEQTAQLHDILDVISSQRYSKEGILSEDILDEWFNAILAEAKAKAELDVLDASIRDLKRQFVRFSPIGTELNRDNRAISFTERSYLSLLEALDEAILRQKNLEMTSATFRVMTPPTVALVAEPKRAMVIIIITAFLTFVFILAMFVVIELFNRKPKDIWQTNKLVYDKVLGAYPLLSNPYSDVAQSLTIQQMGNAAINLFDRTKEKNIINIVSANAGVGKTTIMEALNAYVQSLGMHPFMLSWNKDFNSESKDFMMSFSIYDFAQGVENPEDLINSDVIFVEYPPVSNSNIPSRLVNDAALNIFIVDATKNWLEMDQLLFRQFMSSAKDVPVMICMNKTSNDTVGSFTGMLPPFTFQHKLSFRLNNLGVGNFR